MRLHRGVLAALALLATMTGGLAARAATAPAEIRIGTLYASSGPFASISMPVFDGIKLWVQQVNAHGGVYVKPFHKKIPIKLVAYDDQSSTATAATLYNQLITQDHVNLLLADSGSVLTSVAVPIAKEHKMFLFDVSGTGGTFFTKDNPYIGLMAIPVSTIWPKAISDFLDDVGVKHGIKTVAILYATNDFTGTQASALKGFLEKDGKLKIVYDQGVPTSTSNYTVLINNIAATKPDAVVELGFPGNEIAFLRNLQDSGENFRFVFTIYGGAEMDELLKNAGVPAMQGTFSYVPSALYQVQGEFRPDPAAVPGGVGEGLSQGLGGRMGVERGLRLHDRPCHRAGAGHDLGHEPARPAPCGVRPVGQAQDPGWAVRAERRRRAGGRTHADRAVAAERQGRARSRVGLSAAVRLRQGRVRQVSMCQEAGAAAGDEPSC